MGAFSLSRNLYRAGYALASSHKPFAQEGDTRLNLLGTGLRDLRPTRAPAQLIVDYRVRFSRAPRPGGHQVREFFAFRRT